MDRQSVEALVRRLERVERDNRRWRLAALLALVTLASVLLMGQARPDREIEAEAVTIRNRDGQAVARLGTDTHGLPRLTLIDRDGWARAGMSLSQDGGAYVGLWGSTPQAADPGAPPPARTGAWLSVNPNGGDGTVTLYGPDGQPTWTAPSR